MRTPSQAPGLTRLDQTKLRLVNEHGKEKLADIKKEAPFAYKGIGPVVDALNRANIAKTVAQLHPLLTVKGEMD